MATKVSKSPVPTSTQSSLYYVPRNGQIVKLSWDELTTSERKNLLQAEQRAAYVQQFGIYA